MSEPIVHRAAGVTGPVLRYRTPSYNVASGEVYVEVWGCLYSEMQAKYDALKAAGATNVTTAAAGATATITATFGTVAGSGGAGGGGTGGPVAAITTRWSTSKSIVEIDLARIRTWGLYGDPLSAESRSRAEKLSLIDSLIAKGKLSVVLASTALDDKFKKYAALKAAGYAGAQRASYMITKTTTWPSQKDIDDYLTYENQWKVTLFAALGAPIKEPKFREIDTSGEWALVPYEWLWMPPDSDVIGRSWTLSEQWLGAYKWKGELYDGGTG
jgi:hypothetical protein